MIAYFISFPLILYLILYKNGDDTLKKYTVPIIIAIVLIALICFFYFRSNSLPLGQSNNSFNTYESSRVSTENQIQNNATSETETVPKEPSAENTTIEVPVPAITEQELSSFSTKVSGTSARKNNISICSSLLDGTTVEAGQTFSFWKTVGSTTAEKGYQKAKSFDENGKTIQTYGGGVCQVSTTLYNAVLPVSNLKVTERHPHSKPVTYVAKDKDASVCYSSSDFKFVNNTSDSIKIYTNYDNKTLSIRIVKLSNS